MTEVRTEPIACVAVGETVNITLSAPMTGHAWGLEDADRALWELVNRTVRPGQAMGEGPRTTWTIRFRKPGPVFVTASLRRPFEASVARRRIFPFDVKD